MDPFRSTDIKYFHEHDILCGKSKQCTNHIGNQRFRELIRELRTEYASLDKRQKKEFAERLLQKIQSQRPPGRFLKQSVENLQWFAIGYDQALFKVRQALREGGPSIQSSIKLGNLQVETNFYETGEAPSLDSASIENSESLELMPSQSLEEKGQIASFNTTNPSLEKVRISQQPCVNGMDNTNGEAMNYDIEPIPLQQIDDSSASPASMRKFFNNITSPRHITPQQQQVQYINYHGGKMKAPLTNDRFHNEGEHWSSWGAAQDSIQGGDDRNIRNSQATSGHSWNNGYDYVTGEPGSFAQPCHQTYPPYIGSYEQEFHGSYDSFANRENDWVELSEKVLSEPILHHPYQTESEKTTDQTTTIGNEATSNMIQGNAHQQSAFSPITRRQESSD